MNLPEGAVGTTWHGTYPLAQSAEGTESHHEIELVVSFYAGLTPDVESGACVFEIRVPDQPVKHQAGIWHIKAGNDFTFPLPDTCGDTILELPTKPEHWDTVTGRPNTLIAWRSYADGTRSCFELKRAPAVSHTRVAGTFEGMLAASGNAVAFTEVRINTDASYKSVGKLVTVNGHGIVD
ncbi:hypothetical protein ACIQ9Q_42830 [Streptomyces sp. NPDC094438]|uniref:hypothetical protein n=1 Tax=Streptomyces sp. NPDC094438 TaxID=3366061 RepID=UPI003809F740